MTEIILPEQSAPVETTTIEDDAETQPSSTVHASESGDTPLNITLVPQPELSAAPQTPVVHVVKPVSTLTPAQKAERFFTQAQRALSSGQQRNGEQLLRRALDENPRHVAARSQMVALLLNRHEELQAEQLLADGLISDADQLALARPYARLLAERGELIPALETLDHAIGQQQPDAETLALRAALLYGLERLAESAEDYRKALRIQANRGLWWSGLAVALEQDGQRQQALVAFRRAAHLPLNKPVDEYVKQRIRALSSNESYD